ncbi:MAG: HAD family hydrolase [Candidatus Bathyarchaeia archaeon]
MFDLEGTLVETVYERSSQSVDHLRRETKRKLIALGVSAEALGGLVRSTLLLNLAFEWVETNMSRSESARFHAELDAFMKTFEMRSARLARLYPDTLEALSTLAAGGIQMGVVTNTSREAADHMLGSLGLARFFRVVVTRSDAPRLKPDSTMIRLAVGGMEVPVGWLVGDTTYDAEAAKRAELRSIIVRRDGIRPSFDHDHFVTTLTGVAPIVFEGAE